MSMAETATSRRAALAAFACALLLPLSSVAQEPRATLVQRVARDWLASLNPEEGQVYVDAPYAWREVAGEVGRDLHWLEDDERPLTTLQRLSRVRRLAA